MKICFFGKLTNALIGQTQGGAELQISLLAKSLAMKGDEVVIIDPFAESSFRTSDGIQVLNVPNWNKGIRGLRFFIYKIPSLFKLFKEQNADYYYVRMRYYLYLIPFLISKRTRAKFILSIACDLDVLSIYKKYKYEYKGNIGLFKFLTLSLPNDLVFKYLLNNADIVVFQHKEQQELAGKLSNKSFVFPNIIDLKNFPLFENRSGLYYIYVGSLTLLKGSDIFLNLVNKLPNIPIVIVGQPRDQKSALIFEELKKYPNVVLKGWLNHQDTIQLIAKAKALINTSHYEGFPNIFLESWALGVPVISLNVNPDNILNKYQLGICCEGDLQKMQEYIESSFTDKFLKENLMSYVSTFHDFESSALRFTSLLADCY